MNRNCVTKTRTESSEAEIRKEVSYKFLFWLKNLYAFKLIVRIKLF